MRNKEEKYSVKRNRKGEARQGKVKARKSGVSCMGWQAAEKSKSKESIGMKGKHIFQRCLFGERKYFEDQALLAKFSLRLAYISSASSSSSSSSSSSISYSFFFPPPPFPPFLIRLLLLLLLKQTSDFSFILLSFQVGKSLKGNEEEETEKIPTVSEVMGRRLKRRRKKRRRRRRRRRRKKMKRKRGEAIRRDVKSEQWERQRK